MATTKVTDLIGRAETILFDETHVRWPRQELLGWYNDAIKAVINRRPDACTITVAHPATAGTKQTIPADGLRFIKLTRNLYAAGSKRVITQEVQSTLDRNLPTWHTASDDDAMHYIFDPLVPKTFYVYPGATANSEYELVYTQVPTDAAIPDGSWESDNSTIGLDDAYVNALIDFVLFRAYAKSSDAQDLQRAQAHLAVFEGAIGNKSQADGAVAGAA